MSSPHIGVLFSRVRVEEKWIFAALEKQGLNYSRINDSKINFDLEKPEHWKQYDVILARNLSYMRGLYALRILNSWGIKTVNSVQVAETCGDKLHASAILLQAGIPQPKTAIAFTPQSAMGAIEEMGYPVVLKPLVGSWGRLLSKINDRDAAETILEHKSTLGSPQHSIFYIQEYIHKPSRDMRAFVINHETVCAIYRSSPHWITNTARGGTGENCPVTSEINELCLRVSNAVGGGILAIDLVEHPEEGLQVIEVNHNMEFHTTVPLTRVDLPNLIVNYLIDVAETRILPIPIKHHQPYLSLTANISNNQQQKVLST